EYNVAKPRHLPLLKSALQLQTSNEEQSGLWTPLADQGWRPCITPTNAPWLNQQRMGICDAVAVAKILNATLVIPYFEVNPVWQDSSSFMDIFDVDHFIDVLKDDISIVKGLPDEYSWSTREYYSTAIRATRIKTAPVHASANWYLENVLPVLQSYGIAAVAPFSHRLTFDTLPMDIQRLRCKVNFQALVFVSHIRELGDALVNRLRYPSRENEEVGNDLLRETTNVVGRKRSARKFVVDMAAHSACDFGGGKAEKLSLAKYRQAIWQGRVLNSQFTDEELRSQGRCPLTPEEIGLLLAALGFDNNTRLYLASHKVYGGEARISNLRKLFPLMENKKSLASSEERAQIKGKASLLAAVDYYVGMHSDIFVSASPGNMHNALVSGSCLLLCKKRKTLSIQMGHRSFLNLKTIRPNMALLGPLFLNKNISWSDFRQSVVEGHENRQGQLRLRKPKQSIYTYPAPDCMCHA
ncbi:O-fucosyltransferase 39, partial [Turnera subulata]